LLVDTHCHLNFNAFDDDRIHVVQRAREAGLSQILNPGIDLPSSHAAVKLAETFPEVYAAVGVHPNDALSWDESSYNELQQLAGHPKTVAIGEIGLDYYWKKAPADLQQQIFKEQLKLAAHNQLPVIIHVRDADHDQRPAMHDCLSILQAWHSVLIQAGNPLAEHPGVLHSFSGTVEDARQASAMNFYLGITGPITFPKSAMMQAVAIQGPADRLLIETDAPFLTPIPFRGRRNEPAYVRYVAEKIAEINSYTYDKLSEITTQNAGRLFHW
jgi:TatD DNase family protein